MQESTLSLYFPYLLSDTILQFPALDVLCAYYTYDNGFDYIKSSSQIVCRDISSAKREESAQLTERAVHIELYSDDKRLFSIKRSVFAKQSP